MAKVKQYSVAEMPSPGSVYVFQVKDGRYAACRIVKIVTDDFASRGWCDGWLGACATVALATYLGNEIPKLSDPHLQETLLKTHHSFKGEHELYLVDSPPGERFHFIGVVTSPDVDREKNYGQLMTWWDRIDGEHLVMQHEWDNGDPEAILAREAAEEQKRREEERAKNAARKTKLEKLGLKQFRRQKFFAKWEGYIKPKIVAAKARRIFREAIDAMINLGEKPKKPGVLKVLKHLMANFNELAKKYPVFETVERDDICDAFGDLCFLVKLKNDPTVLFENLEDM